MNKDLSSMNKHIKIILITIFALAIAILLGFSLIANGTINIDFYKMGEEAKEFYENDNKNDAVMFEVNGVPITYSEYNEYKLGAKYHANPLTEEDIINQLKRKCIITAEIKKKNITADKSEIDKFHKERMEAARNDAESIHILDEYLNGRGMTFEEYAEMSYPISERAVLTNKLIDVLYSEYLSQKPEDEEPLNKYSYFQNFIKNEINNAIVQYFNNDVFVK